VTLVYTCKHQKLERDINLSELRAKMDVT